MTDDNPNLFEAETEAAPKRRTTRKKTEAAPKAPARKRAAAPRKAKAATTDDAPAAVESAPAAQAELPVALAPAPVSTPEAPAAPEIPAAPVPAPAPVEAAQPVEAAAQPAEAPEQQAPQQRQFRGDRPRHHQQGRHNNNNNNNQQPQPQQQRPQQPPRPPEPPTFAEGIVEVSGKGFGFLREPRRNFSQSNNDVFVTPEVVRKHALRDGMWIRGETRRGSRGPQLFKLLEIEGQSPDSFQNLPVFEELTTISPNKRIRLETVPERYTTRVMDLMTPIGKGQRGLIVAPPRTGKTTLLQHIADAVVQNHPR